MQKHNYFIDMLRFFAASIVVFFHLNQAIPPVDNWYRDLISYGWLGVPIFFVISGYCIIISAYNSSSMPEFLNRRFFRVFPPYWASIIIVLFAACFQKVFTGFNSVHDIPRNIPGIAATLTLTTSPLTNIKTINWVYWTLTCELLFYLTMCLLLLFNKKHILFLLIFISLIAWKLPHSNTGILFFLDNWSPFGLGISIYYFFKSTNKMSLIGFGVLLIINILSLFSKFGDHTDYVIVTLIATVLIFLSNYVKFPNNMFAVMGKHSYSVYLIHVPIGVFIIGLFENPYVQQNPIANFIYDITVYLFINIMAWFMYNWIEKPSIAYGRKFSETYFNNNLQKHIA